MIALEKSFSYALQLSLVVGFLIRHAIFEITYGFKCLNEKVVGKPNRESGSKCLIEKVVLNA
ncbi:hypothetical protein AAG906_025130 [Vitis piasezkii]